MKDLNNDTIMISRNGDKWAFVREISSRLPREKVPMPRGKCVATRGVPGLVRCSAVVVLGDHRVRDVVHVEILLGVHGPMH